MIRGLLRGWSERGDGTASAARTARAGLWAVILAGPVLATAALLSGGAGPAGPTRPAVVERPVRSGLGPGEFAVRFVAAWSTAHGEDGTKQVEAFLPDAPDAPSAEPTTRVKGLRVAGAEELRPGYWAVTVSGTALDTSKEKARPGPRLWRVGVLAHGSAAAGGTGTAKEQVAYVAAGLPAQVAVPATAKAPESAYGTAVDGAPGAVGSTVQGFVRLYGTRRDVTRFLAPGVRIVPAGSGFTDARVVRLAAAGDVDLTQDAQARDGQRVRVLATVQPYTEAGPQPLLQYALSLKGRAGRWEVAALDPAPALRAHGHDRAGGAR